MQPIFGALLNLSSRAFAPTRRRDQAIPAENEITLAGNEATLVPNEAIVRVDPFAHLAVERAISLRWTLRDILANRTRLLSVAHADLQVLIDMGLVEMRECEPALTVAGKAAIK